MEFMSQISNAHIFKDQICITKFIKHCRYIDQIQNIYGKYYSPWSREL